MSSTLRSGFDPSVPVLVCVSLIFVCSVWLRLLGTDWDQYASLHPDERHLLFVMSDMLERWNSQAAANLSPYAMWFHTGESPLDPRADGGSFVYGEWPILATTLTAKFFLIDGWDNLLRLGRTLTALVEATSCIAVFMASYRLTHAVFASLSACILAAAAPSALQLANFYAVDGWLMAATAWSTAAMVFLMRNPNCPRAILLGFFCGLAVACKATGVLLAGPVLLTLMVLWKHVGGRRAVRLGAVILLTGLVVFRLANPFVFEGPGLLGLRPSDGMWRSLAVMESIAGAQNFPPNWQWMAGYSALAFWRDFFLFGSGPVLATLALGTLAKFRRPPARNLLAIAGASLACAMVFLNAPLLSDIRALRYAAPAIAPFAIFVAAGLEVLPRSLIAVGVLVALWWGSGVVILHSSTNSRVEASRWLWQATPPGTVLVNETGWDDGLPVKVAKPDGGFQYPDHGGHFELLSLQITDDDTPEKARKMAHMLSRASFVVQSSGRQRDVMPRMPERFPMTAAYYRAISAGTLCFSPVWDKGDQYPLPLFPFNDGFAQEPWRVYDHPRVIIYQPTACRNSAFLEDFLKSGLLQK